MRIRTSNSRTGAITAPTSASLTGGAIRTPWRPTPRSTGLVRSMRCRWPQMPPRRTGSPGRPSRSAVPAALGAGDLQSARARAAAFRQPGFPRGRHDPTGIKMRIVGRDATPLRGATTDTSYVTNSILIGAGESFDAIFTAPRSGTSGQDTYVLYNRRYTQADDTSAGTSGQRTRSTSTRQAALPPGIPQRLGHIALPFTSRGEITMSVHSASGYGWGQPYLSSWWPAPPVSARWRNPSGRGAVRSTHRHRLYGNGVSPNPTFSLGPRPAISPWAMATPSSCGAIQS